MKRCSKCKEVKGLEEFYKDRTRKDGLDKSCKACQAAYRAKNREQRAAHDAAYRAQNRERIAARQEAYNAENREQKLAYQAAYYAKNRERIAAYQAAYRTKNRERQAAHRAKHRERIAAYQATYRRNRRRTDSDFRLRCNLRCRLGVAIRSNAKTGSAVRDLGCSISELRLHLKSQFQPGMDWENYGTLWHIDHIYPLTKADLSDRVEFLAVNNWRNLRPMLGPENLQKKDAVTPEAQRLFDRLVQEFSDERRTAQGSKNPIPA